MTLKELVEEAHKTAVENGWYDIISQFEESNQEDKKTLQHTPTPLEVHALIHSEISEATECVRNDYVHYFEDSTDDNKPEGESVELADAIIRIADYFGSKGWDLENIVKKKMEYNKTRPYRHGNKII